MNNLEQANWAAHEPKSILKTCPFGVSVEVFA